MHELHQDKNPVGPYLAARCTNAVYVHLQGQGKHL